MVAPFFTASSPCVLIVTAFPAQHPISINISSMYLAGTCVISCLQIANCWLNAWSSFGSFAIFLWIERTFPPLCSFNRSRISSAWAIFSLFSCFMVCTPFDCLFLSVPTECGYENITFTDTSSVKMPGQVQETERMS